ncbi:hypothetical protein LG299_03660 [Microbacterium lacus]|uniref:general stress protein n=1 Tax=Microbacterium lacus TaxID=415217 RepID=UPI00384B089B
MTMMGGRFTQGPDDVGQSVADFPSYERAQKAVSTLIAADVPARQIAIVGKGLRSVERVTGRLGYAAAARSGAVNGILLGLLFSAILVIGTPSVPIQAFVGVLFVGIAIGMLMSLITYTIVRRRRDFASVTQVVADHYEVTVAAGNAARARQILGASASAPVVPAEVPSTEATPVSAPDARPTPPEREVEPPRYGERVPPVAVDPTPEPVDEPDTHIVETPATSER